MKKKVSIIVPVYNVKDYLAKCLDSLVSQDFDSFDVIVINDGSPFGEEEIINEFYSKYPDIIVPINKENGGYGSGLEVGIARTESEYILVCDSDDYLSSDCLKSLYEKASTNNDDIVVGAKNLVYSDNNEIKYDKSFNDVFSAVKENYIYVKGNEDFKNLFFIDPSPHAKLYRTELVRNLEFPHKVSFTDNLLYFCSLSKASRVEYVSEALSFYLINRVGNTMTDVKPKIIDDYVTVFRKIVEEAEVSSILMYRMFDSFFEIFWQVDRIKGDINIKREKYKLVYSFLADLLKYSDIIIKEMDLYSKDSNAVKKQKKGLLNADKSEKIYWALAENRLNPSFINKLKLRLYVL